MVDKYLITDNELQSASTERPGYVGRLTFLRDNGDVIDAGTAVGEAVTDGGMASVLANPDAAFTTQLSAKIDDRVAALGSPVGKAFRGLPLITYGHSFLAEQGLTDPADYYARKLAARLGMVYPTLTVANDLKRAVGGSRAEDAATRLVGTAAPFVAGTKAVVLIEALINSARKWGITADSIAGSTNAVRAMVAAVSAQQRIEDTDVLFTKAGGWTSGAALPQASGGAYSYTATAGATVKFVVPAQGCYLLTLGRKSGLAANTFTVSAGGETLATVTNQNQAPSDITGNYVPMAVPLDVPEGTEVTVTNTAGNFVLDALLVPASNPIPVLLMKEPYLADYSLSTMFPNGSDAVLDAFNDILDTVASEFPNVIVADPNTAGFWDKTTDIQSDGVHPNETGNEALADTAMSALNESILASTIRSIYGLD